MFNIVAGKVVIDVKSLSIPPFAEYWENTKDKAHAENVIKYAVFMYKWNTPYKAYAPEERSTKICKDVFGNPSISFASKDVEFVNRYREFLATPLTRLLDAAEEGVEYLIRQFNSLRAKELEVDNNGKPIITAKEVYAWLEKIGNAVKSLDTLKKQVQAEQVDGSKVKGGSEIGHYELPKR
jgi:hypothetical protein